MVGYTRGWERAKKIFFLKIFKFPYGQFPPKMPGPVSQTKLKTKTKFPRKKKILMAEMRF